MADTQLTDQNNLHQYHYINKPMVYWYNGVHVESHVKVTSELCITANDDPFSAIETGSESMECIQTAVLSVSAADFCIHGMQDVVRRLKEGVFQNLVL